MINKINTLKAEIEALTAADTAEVEALRIKYLSKKGAVSALFNDFRTVPADQKKAMGAALNELKTLATDKINALREALENTDTVDDSLDLTRSARCPCALAHVTRCRWCAKKLLIFSTVLASR